MLLRSGLGSNSSAIKLASGILLCLIPFTTAKAQNLIIPQIADGGAWQTTLVLTNTTSSTASASLSFFEETGGGATQPWNLQFLEAASTQNLSVAAGGTLILHSQDNPSGPTSVGWAQLQGSAFSAYAIFTQIVPGRQNQDATATAAVATSRALVPFDNSDGLVTAVAIANTTGSSESIAVGLQPASGSSSQLTAITIPAQGHASFSLPTQFGATNAISGTLEFYSASGSFAILALRANPTGAFTAAPIYAESGPPIIGGSGGGPSGSLPQFNLITTSLTLSTSFGELKCASQIYGGVGDYIGSELGICMFPLPTTSPVSLFVASFNNVTVSGHTFTLSGISASSSTMSSTSTNLPSAITSGSVTLTFNPQGAPSIGTVTGSFTLTSVLATVSGSISGSYTAN
jgi:hypothetical protein